MESYSEDPAAMIANSPWSGFYHTREVLWGYAHYGQFSKAGWQYLNGGCGKLSDGGTFVTLKSPGKDYSVIVETKNAKSVQNMTFNIGGGLATGKLCVWRSDAKEQFVQLASIKLKDNSFTLALEPNSIYSISTTRGQRKGSFENIPASQKFPFPYYETFDGYASPKQFGYLPHSPAFLRSPNVRTRQGNVCARSSAKNRRAGRRNGCLIRFSATSTGRTTRSARTFIWTMAAGPASWAASTMSATVTAACRKAII
jgi:hypothetical protein